KEEDDKKVEAILLEIIPFEISAPKCIKSIANDDANLLENISEETSEEDEVQKPTVEHRLNSNSITTESFDLDPRDKQYGILVIGEYLKKKYLNPIFRALGYETGAISWKLMEHEITNRLNTVFANRRGFLLH